MSSFECDRQCFDAWAAGMRRHDQVQHSFCPSLLLVVAAAVAARTPSKLRLPSEMDPSQRERWERDWEAMTAPVPDLLQRWANDGVRERLTVLLEEEEEARRGGGVERRRLAAAVEEERRCPSRRRVEEERDRAVARAEEAEAKAEAAVAAWEGERRRAGEAEERAKKAEEKAEKNKEEARRRRTRSCRAS